MSGIFHWSKYELQVVEALNKSRREGLFCDVMLISDDHHQAAAHRVVLSAASEYFYNNLKLDSNTCQQTKICLEGTTKQDLENILDFIYNGRVAVTEEHLDSFNKLATRLKLIGFEKYFVSPMVQIFLTGVKTESVEAASDLDKSRELTGEQHRENRCDIESNAVPSLMNLKAEEVSKEELLKESSDEELNIAIDDTVSINSIEKELRERLPLETKISLQKTEEEKSEMQLKREKVNNLEEKVTHLAMEITENVHADKKSPHEDKLKELLTRGKCLNEELQLLLECLDSLELQEDQLEEKSRRKSVAKLINKVMDHNDENIEKIRQIQNRNRDSDQKNVINLGHDQEKLTQLRKDCLDLEAETATDRNNSDLLAKRKIDDLKDIDVSIKKQKSSPADSENITVDIDPLVIAERLAEEVRDEGNQLYGQQRYAEAAAKYSEAIALFPRSAAFYGNRGACQLMLGDTRGCVADCGRALALDPGYTRVRLRRARCYLDTRLAREAARDLELVLRTDPSNAEARQLLHRARLQDKTQNRRRLSNRRSVPSVPSKK